jgi:hypothetical protein
MPKRHRIDTAANTLVLVCFKTPTFLHPFLYTISFCPITILPNTRDPLLNNSRVLYLYISGVLTISCNNHPKPCSTTRDYANSVYFQLIYFVVCLVPNKVRRCVVSKKTEEHNQGKICMNISQPFIGFWQPLKLRSTIKPRYV